jgi:Flp pilus assembly protein TadD
MSRFNSLEFEDNSEQFESQPILKDEHFYLAQAKEAFESANFEQGLRHYAKVLEFNPKNATAWTGQVRMLIELGEFLEAKLWADKALEKFPTEPELLAAKAVALARLGDSKTALAFSDASIEERGDTSYIWLARGDVLLANGEKRADYCIEKATLAGKSDWFIQWLASRIYAFYKKFSVALKHAQEALNLNSTKAAVWIQAGRCQLAMGLIVLAENSFMQAQQLDPHSTDARDGLIAVSNRGFLSKTFGRLKQLFA